jgi:hypothetical protein
LNGTDFAPGTYPSAPEQWQPRLAEFCQLVRKPPGAAEVIAQAGLAAGVAHGTVAPDNPEWRLRREGRAVSGELWPSRPRFPRT